MSFPLLERSRQERAVDLTVDCPKCGVKVGQSCTMTDWVHMDRHLKAIKGPPDPIIETITVNKKLYQSISFLIEGAAIMEPLKLFKPDLHHQFVELARLIEKERKNRK